ncbi:MAG: hypothetical protein HYY13_10465 [Nitrospirae bacterium]|nr:hypothetical protein [Nitrospirota bacterium]
MRVIGAAVAVLSSACGLDFEKKNLCPAANAGEDRFAQVGEINELDAGHSSDRNGDPIAYKWSLLTKPEGSTAAIDDADGSRVGLIPDVEGRYVFALKVTDGRCDSPEDKVVVTATKRPFTNPGQCDANTLGLYHLDEDTGYVAANECKPGLPDGAIAGPQPEEGGRFGPARRFDGQDDFIEIADSVPSPFAGSNSLTLEAWVRLAADPTQSVQPIFSRRHNKASETGRFEVDVWVEQAETLELRAEVRAGGIAELAAGAEGSTPLPLEKWTHIAFTYDPTDLSIRLYQDGVQQAQAAIPLDLVGAVAAAGPLRIGRRATPQNDPAVFSGWMDEIRISSVLRSPSEFPIDLRDPETFLTALSASAPLSTGAVITLNDVSFILDCDEVGCSFECQLDAQAFTPCVSPVAYTGLFDGPHTFSVRAIDPSDNVDETPAAFTWTIDRTGPSIGSILLATAAGIDRVHLQWSPGKDNRSPPSMLTYELCWSKTSGQCTSQFAVSQSTGAGVLAQTLSGLEVVIPYYFAVRAVDELGNRSAASAEVSARPGSCPAGGWTLIQRVPTVFAIREVQFLGSVGFAVGDGGLIMKTDDGGATWICLSSGVAENLSAIDFPLDTTTGFVVGGAGTILKTTDGGITWTKLTTPTMAALGDVEFPSDATTGFATGTSGVILKTSDGGATWGAVTSGTSKTIRRIEFPGGGSTGFIVGGNGTLLKTTDGGTTWATPTTFLGTTEDLTDLSFPLDTTTGYVLTLGGKVLKTTDGGATWTIWTVSTSLNYSLTAMEFPSDTTAGFVVGDMGTAYKTVDGGQTWTRQPTGTTAPFLDVDFPGGADTGYLVGWGGAVQRTTDGGTTWTSLAGGSTTNLKAAYFFADGMTGFAAGDLGTILKTTDGGATWSSANSTTTAMLLSIQFPNDGSTGFAVGTSGTILKTSDSGASWSALNSGTTQTLTGVRFPQDATTGYVCGGGGNVLKTGNGGASWTNMGPTAGGGGGGAVPGQGQNGGSIPVGNEYVGQSFPTDSSTGYVISRAYVFKTTNGGGSWTQTQPLNLDNSGASINGIHFPKSATLGFLAGNSGQIFKTINGGSNWTPQTSGTGYSLIGIRFLPDELTGYTVGGNGTVLKTTDGGSTWFSQANRANVTLYSVVFPGGGTTGFIVGDAGAILKTTTGGQ